mgnify:CR=1 FL=1
MSVHLIFYLQTSINTVDFVQVWEDLKLLVWKYINSEFKSESVDLCTSVLGIVLSKCFVEIAKTIGRDGKPYALCR